jgi:hypothetical protein
MKTQKKFAIAALFCLTSLTHLASAGDKFDSLDYFDQYASQDKAHSAATIQAQNEEVFQELAGTYINEYPRSAAHVDEQIASEILDGVMNHPVASLRVIRKYDPKGGIGFCFGRAMTVHLESLYRRLSKSAIRKMWAIGDLRTGDMMWRYHVTTILKGPGNEWYAIDPIWGSVLTVRQWYDSMKSFDHDGKMKIYVTPASKFGPGSGKYAKGDLMDPFYNSYFNDLLKHYRQNGAVSGGVIPVTP